MDLCLLVWCSVTLCQGDANKTTKEKGFGYLRRSFSLTMRKTA